MFQLRALSLYPALLCIDSLRLSLSLFGYVLSRLLFSCSLDHTCAIDTFENMTKTEFLQKLRDGHARAAAAADELAGAEQQRVLPAAGECARQIQTGIFKTWFPPKLERDHRSITQRSAEFR